MKRIRKKFCRLKNTENENENHLNLFYIEEVIKIFLFGGPFVSLFSIIYVQFLLIGYFTAGCKA